MENFEVRNAKIEAMMKGIGESIGKALPKGYGFTLLLFNFGEGGDMFYISNSRRKDVIESMKEFIQKQEGIK